MKPDYYIGEGNYTGDDCPNENFNKVTVPRLLELGIKPEDMDELYDLLTSKSKRLKRILGEKKRES